MTAPIETSATSGLPSELGIAIASGFVPASGSPPSGWASRAGEVAVSAAASPPSASRRTYQPSTPVGKQFEATTTRACAGGLGELRIDDRGERQVAERAVAVPALVAGLGDQPVGARVRLQVAERLEPVDPAEPVAELAARLGVEEVLGERRRVRLGEAEGGDPLLRPHGGGWLPTRAAPAPTTKGSPISAGGGGARPDRRARRTRGSASRARPRSAAARGRG